MRERLVDRCPNGRRSSLDNGEKKSTVFTKRATGHGERDVEAVGGHTRRENAGRTGERATRRCSRVNGVAVVGMKRVFMKRESV